MKSICTQCAAKTRPMGTVFSDFPHDKVTIQHYDPTVEYPGPYFLKDTNSIPYLIFPIQGVTIMQELLNLMIRVDVL